MKTTMKKLLSFVLVAVLLVSAIPFQASAATDGAITVVFKVNGVEKETKSITPKGDTVRIGDLAWHYYMKLQSDSDAYAFNNAYAYYENGSAGDIDKDATPNVADLKEVHINMTYTPTTTPETTEAPAETPTAAPTEAKHYVDVVVKLDGVEQPVQTYEIKNTSTTVGNLIDYKVSSSLIAGYKFDTAWTQSAGYIDEKGVVNEGEKVYIAFSKIAVNVEPIDVIVKVDSSDNVVWTGSKVPANGTSSKVEDLLSYCWNKDWDDVYKFDHAWSHEQQKNVARTDSVNAGDTLYIMVKKLDSSKPTTGTTYTVTFYDVNNAEITSVNVASGSKVHVSNFEDAAKYTNIGSGYTFAGWKVGKNGTTTYTNSQAAGLTISGNTGFYAVATKGSGTTNNKFPYKVYLHIFKDNKVDDPAKTIDITNGIALDGKVTLAEVKSVVKNYYTAKNSDGIGYDGMYMAKGNWVGNFVNDTKKYDTIEDTNEMRKEAEVHINVMITNANAKSSSSSNADTSNPKTGDTFTATMTIMTISASALVLVYFFNKKRALAK